MKEVSNWKISSILVVNVICIHWLVRMFGGDLLEAIMGVEKALIYILSWQGVLLSVIGIVAGFLYSRWSFAKKGYIIEDASKIALRSTVLFAVVALAINIFIVLMVASIFEVEINFSEGLPGTLLNVLIISIVFYLLTRTFIRNTQPKDNPSSNI